jgi:hypothetical protein
MLAKNQTNLVLPVLCVKPFALKKQENYSNLQYTQNTLPRNVRWICVRETPQYSAILAKSVSVTLVLLLFMVFHQRAKHTH